MLSEQPRVAGITAARDKISALLEMTMVQSKIIFTTVAVHQ